MFCRFARDPWAEAWSSLAPAFLVPLRHDVDCGPQCWATSVLFQRREGLPRISRISTPTVTKIFTSTSPRGNVCFG